MRDERNKQPTAAAKAAAREREYVERDLAGWLAFLLKIEKIM